MHKEEKLHRVSVPGQGSTHISLDGTRLKIVFFHNTLPEYRIGWFTELSNLADVDFVFTNESLNKKDYGFDIDYKRSEGLKCIFLKEGKEGERQLDRFLENISDYDFVELPPIDSYREVVCGRKIVKACRKYGVKIGFFWEKWEAPKDKQPIKRQIKNLILRIVPKSIYNHADLIFAVGCKSKEYFLSNGIDEKKIVTIPDVSETPACEYEDIRDKYGISEDKKIVMFLGRLMPQKGAQCLIRAFAGLKSELREECHLLIAGDGDDRESCEKLAGELGILNITFAGAIDPKVRGNYFMQCNIFVYPVNYITGWVDVWGLTVNEAVQHGKIVIATDAVGSAYELIEDGINGFRVEPDKVEALKNALEKALEGDMAERAKAKDAELMTVYNFKTMAEKYISAL